MDLKWFRDRLLQKFTSLFRNSRDTVKEQRDGNSGGRPVVLAGEKVRGKEVHGQEVC